MIRPLRRLHRLAMPGVGVVALTIVGLALAGRPEPARQDVLPEAMRQADVAHGADQRTGEFTVDRGLVRWSESETRLELSAPAGLAPDIQVFLSPVAGTVTLPAEARWIGEFSTPGTTDWSLSWTPDQRPRFLLLYSVAHGELLASVDLDGGSS